MPFSVNDPFLFWLSGIVIAAVLAESVFFLVKAVRRARELNLSKGTIRKTILSSGLFSLAPAVSILIGVLTLNRFLGLPFPWLRLSILGAVTYELPAATIAANAVGAGVTETITSAQTFAVIAWTMTLGIIAGIVLILFGLKKLQKGMNTISCHEYSPSAEGMAAVSSDGHRFTCSSSAGCRRVGLSRSTRWEALSAPMQLNSKFQ